MPAKESGVLAKLLSFHSHNQKASTGVGTGFESIVINYFLVKSLSTNCWLKCSTGLPVMLWYTALANMLLTVLITAIIKSSPITTTPAPTIVLVKVPMVIAAIAQKIPAINWMNTKLKPAPILSPQFCFII